MTEGETTSGIIILYMSNANTVVLTTADFTFLSKRIHLISILYRLLLYKLHVAEPDSGIIILHVLIRMCGYKCNQVCVCMFKLGCLDSRQADGSPIKTDSTISKQVQTQS